MYRSYGIKANSRLKYEFLHPKYPPKDSPEYLESQKFDIYERDYNGRAQKEFDDVGYVYSYKFSSVMDLDRWSKENEIPQKINVLGYDITDRIYESMVKDFAYELAHRMKYTNYKVLENQGINPSMVIWDEK